jgi:membrane protein DedA with SNARE-associated domain
LDPTHLLQHWGYTALFAIEILGNVGVPLPEEAALVVAGYFIWLGKLRCLPVLFTGALGAVIGDNLGFWFGRHYGQSAIQHYGHKFLITTSRLDAAKRFVGRYGSVGVFFARFLPGLRFMAGPLAGCTGMSFVAFFIANVLGGLIYVPLAVGVGYLLGYRFGSVLRKLELIEGKVEHFAIAILGIAALAIIVWRALGSRKAARRSSEDWAGKKGS